MSVWNRYQPTEQEPWNFQRVVHLHRRTVFGASQEEVQRDLADKPQTAVTRILEGNCRARGIPKDFETLSDLIGQSAVSSSSPQRLKAWWLYRFLFTPDPLAERLTLMWHNHFATSNLKVADLSQMKAQNETMRQHATAPFGELLRAMVRDPALLRWLDAPANRKGHANENLARELMELFTLGIGNYSEQDVIEAARALTGWTVRNNKFFESAVAHDSTAKTILGASGHWKTPDLIKMLLDHPATAERLAWRLTSEFFGENVVDGDALEELAGGLRDHDLDIGWAVEKMLRSQLFFSEANLASRVCDPLTFLLAPIRLTQYWRQPPSTLVLSEWLSRFGQDLFYPPNVGGWNGGRSWLTTRSVIARTNYAHALATGAVTSPSSPPDLKSILSIEKTFVQSAHLYAELMFGSADEQMVSRVCKETIDETNREDLNTAFAKLLTDGRAHLH